ncbi:MAG: hypothetical protein C0596_09065 [Marinilabiliales bacterium]|nr:MAG: hypothetical protein C0596_09065 [Marinilabiliales bacterium]
MKKIWYILVLLPLFYCGTCNQEKVDGEIKMETQEISVGDTLVLEAEIYDKEKELKSIMWDVDSADNVILISPVYEDGDSTEYKALFIPLKPGEYNVLLSCFYKQTNPTFIDEKQIAVK